jgi:hypothetical protein
MQRYKVTIVASSNSRERPVLLVPFRPSALVTAFVDELFKRIARQGLAIAPDTHIAALRLDSETGALIDLEDVLSDVVLDPNNDKLFAVFSEKQGSNGVSSSAQGPVTCLLSQGSLQNAESLAIRVVTAKGAKDLSRCPIIKLPITSTVRALHDAVADQLHLPKVYDEDNDACECNCHLARRLSIDPAEEKSFFVVHGKSVVERLTLRNQTETSLRAALKTRFGANLESSKEAELIGAEYLANLPTVYKKNPAVAICSKVRHKLAYSAAEAENADNVSSILDLHTSEVPIHSGCMDSTLGAAGLGEMSIDGILDIYCVTRRTAGRNLVDVGKSEIFRVSSAWEPANVQSDRGMAIYLSSLRVFTSLVQDMRDEHHLQDAVLHTFDLLTQFPPALRTLYILSQGKTPSAAEKAAFSAAMFEILDSFMSKLTHMIGNDHTRVFEGARLFFGFVLEKSKNLKLPSEDDASYPYILSLQTRDLHDHRTHEAIMHAVQTTTGLVEASVFRYLQEGGLLASTSMQTFMVQTPIDAGLARAALLSAGRRLEIVTFSRVLLDDSYRYPDGGNVNAAIDVNELAELSYLADLCGRNELDVCRPSQLASAVSPCLTFDRNAHLAVYTGEQPCGDPGHSSVLFRPKHEEVTIDTAVVEQLIAPLLAGYEADGTAVFDALGGAAVRKMQAPDEILMFCVDTSASMRSKTDFAGVDDQDEPHNELSDEAKVQNLIESELYGTVTFDDVKVSLCVKEGFDDMIALISGADSLNRRRATKGVMKILRILTAAEILEKTDRMQNRRQHGGGWFHVRQELQQDTSELQQLKTFWAGLKTHEEALEDFLIYRATTLWPAIWKRWYWTIGDQVPTSGSLDHIPALDHAIVEMPRELECPISQTLMFDAVTVKDGHTYSHSAISKWFGIRKSSPMTGLQLEDTSVTSNQQIREAAQRWIMGDNIVSQADGSKSALKRLKSKQLEITFDSRFGSFTRDVMASTTMEDLYKLAFRGLKGQCLTFQLSTDKHGPLAPTQGDTVISKNLRQRDHVTIRIAEDAPSSGTMPTKGSAGDERALIKVYSSGEKLLFGFWVNKNACHTMTTVMWKYWRYQLQQNAYVHVGRKQIWLNLSQSGDNMLSGSPQNITAKLSTFLTRSFCSGHLGEETVYRDESRLPDSSAPLVMKLEVDDHPFVAKTVRKYLTRLDVLKQMFEVSSNESWDLCAARVMLTSCRPLSIVCSPTATRHMSA